MFKHLYYLVTLAPLILTMNMFSGGPEKAPLALQGAPSAIPGTPSSVTPSSVATTAMPHVNALAPSVLTPASSKAPAEVVMPAAQTSVITQPAAVPPVVQDQATNQTPAAPAVTTGMPEANALAPSGPTPANPQGSQAEVVVPAAQTSVVMQPSAVPPIILDQATNPTQAAPVAVQPETTQSAIAPLTPQPAITIQAEAVPAAPAETNKIRTAPQATVVEVKPEVEEPQEKVAEVDLIAKSQTQFDEGIDTLDEEDSGNWYLKRSFWKKAKPKYDQIRKIAGDVERSIKSFLDKRKIIEQANEKFFLEVGVDQGEINQIIHDLLESEKALKTADAQAMTEEEKTQQAELKEKRRKDLEELKLYFDVIKKTDENLMDAIFNSLIEQQQLAQSYEEKALENYYQISEILDDQKARELLNEMDNYVENVTAIDTWINGPLSNYVEQSATRLTDLMQKSRMLVSQLKNQGIEIKKAITQEEADKELARKKIEAEELAKAKAAARAAMQDKGIMANILSALSNFFSALFDMILSPFTYLYNLVFGPASALPKPVHVIKNS